jgi:glutaconyl-CoA/methylmalonyl-CoA decarboxylase subunit gamma
MKFRLAGHPEEFDIELTRLGGGSIRARINGALTIEAIVDFSIPDGAIVRIGRQAARVLAMRRRGSICVATGPAQFELIPVEARSGRRAHGLATPEITAPMPGKVVKVTVTEGQRVEPGDVLMVLEAMKMESALHAESEAVVKKICANVGQMVDHGAVLLVLGPVPAPSSDGAASSGR